MNGPVELLGVLASGLLVLVAVGISAGGPGLRLERDLFTAAVRAAAQLALLGLVLVAMLAPGQPLALSWLWVAVMIVFAGWTVQRRVPGVPGSVAAVDGRLRGLGRGHAGRPLRRRRVPGRAAPPSCRWPA